MSRPRVCGAYWLQGEQWSHGALLLSCSNTWVTDGKDRLQNICGSQHVSNSTTYAEGTPHRKLAVTWNPSRHASLCSTCRPFPACLPCRAWDVAAAIANYSPLPLDPNVKLAANAAAGRWSEVAAALESEQGRSLHAPGPPPRGGALHGKMCAAARGALLHGQLGKASELLQAAGGNLIMDVGCGDVQLCMALQRFVDDFLDFAHCRVLVDNQAVHVHD